VRDRLSRLKDYAEIDYEAGGIVGNRIKKDA
jgi:hypothetical protein